MLVCVAIGSSIAGCNGSTSGQQAEPNLAVVDGQGEVTLTGDVEVVATVTNDGNAEGTGELWAEVILSNDESFSESKVVQVGPGETKEYKLEIDIPITGFTSLSDATLDVWID